MSNPATPMVTVHLDGGPKAGRTLQRPPIDEGTMPLEIFVPDPDGTHAHIYRLVHRLIHEANTVGSLYEFTE